MTRTAKSQRQSQHLAEPFVEIHPRDAAGLGIRDADIVRISSADHFVLARALLSKRQARGAVFVPMHWNDQFASRARIDSLVPQTTDPQSGQPAFKNVGVDVARFEATTYGFAVLRERPRDLDADYWALAKCRGGWRLELALAGAARDWTGFANSLFGCGPDADLLFYQDMTGGQHRFACFEGERLIGALFLAAEPVSVSRDWAVEQLSVSFDEPRRRFSIIAARPGAGGFDRGATICSCFGVGANQITAAIAAGCHSVEAIGQSTQAGTNCGSCRAEIRKIIEANPQLSPAHEAGAHAVSEEPYAATL
jgi:assimilatory nitrate reductase catalytic subunit